MSSGLNEAAIEHLRDEFRESLYSLAKIGLKYKDINLETHGKIIETLESDVKRKLICVPRGCLKSSLACVAFPIWILLNEPNARILIDSELYTNSATFLREIKGHLTSPLFSSIFGSFKTTCWNEA